MCSKLDGRSNNPKGTNETQLSTILERLQKDKAERRRMTVTSSNITWFQGLTNMYKEDFSQMSGCGTWNVKVRNGWESIWVNPTGQTIGLKAYMWTARKRHSHNLPAHLQLRWHRQNGSVPRSIDWSECAQVVNETENAHKEPSFVKRETCSDFR